MILLMYHAASESHFGSQLDVFFDLTEPKYTDLSVQKQIIYLKNKNSIFFYDLSQDKLDLTIY